MDKTPKTVAILIAFEAERTLESFYKNLPVKLFDDIILVDDASQDNTVAISERLGIITYKNKRNLGYGGNLKKALRIALQKKAEIIVDIHPDGEYKTNTIPEAIDLAKSGSELVLGNRFNDLNYIFNKSGMYVWKIVPLMLLNFISKIILKTNVQDLHQGFRIYSRKLLNKIPFEDNSNKYLFSFQLIAQAVFVNSRISQVSVKTKYSGNKRGANFINSLIYTSGTIFILGQFILAELGFKTKIFLKPTSSLYSRLKNM